MKTPLVLTLGGAIVLGSTVLAMTGLTALSATAQDAAPASPTATPTVDEIVERTNRASYYAGKDGRAKVSMTITDRQGRERTRRFTILRRDEPGPAGSGEEHTGEQQFYIYFERPADVNRMGFLVHKHLDRDDDRWLFLPALDLVKRIAASDKRTSFVGSDFFYEDVSGRRTSDDRHELVDTTEHYYVLKNTQVDRKSVEFSHFQMWIHKTTFLPVKIEYFDEKGEKYREYVAEGVEEIDGHWTVTKASMSDLRTKSRTVLEYSNVTYDIGIPEDVFTERSLRKPPRKWLK